MKYIYLCMCVHTHICKKGIFTSLPLQAKIKRERSYRSLQTSRLKSSKLFSFTFWNLILGGLDYWIDHHGGMEMKLWIWKARSSSFCPLLIWMMRKLGHREHMAGRATHQEQFSSRDISTLALVSIPPAHHTARVSSIFRTIPISNIPGFKYFPGPEVLIPKD